MLLDCERIVQRLGRRDDVRGTSVPDQALEFIYKNGSKGRKMNVSDIFYQIRYLVSKTFAEMEGKRKSPTLRFTMKVLKTVMKREKMPEFLLPVMSHQ